MLEERKMTQTLESPASILRTWAWCQEAFVKHGIKLDFPKNTDPKKTYQWRYATRLSRKIDEWELDRDTARAYIKFAVEYIKDKRLLHKGLTAFFQNNMMDVCYNKMQNSISMTDNRIAKLIDTRKFLESKCMHRPFVKVLLGRESFDKFRNIVRWSQSKDISQVYMSISASCTAALANLAIIAPNERGLLMSDSDLYQSAQEFLSDNMFRLRAKTILGNDWRPMPCLR